jgi:multiple sugar transport system permease protein
VVSRAATPWLFLTPALVLVGLVTLYPFGYSLVISFQDVQLTRLGDARFIGLENYRELLSDPAFHHSLLLSVAYVAGSVVGSLLVGFALALIMNQELRGMVVFRSLLIIPMVVTPVSIGLTWRMMYSDQTGIINAVLGSLGLPRPLWIESPDSALLSVILADIWEWTPFMFLLLLAGLRSLPLSPFESARVDGASAWQRFWFLTVPMMRPVIAVAVILRAVDALRIFDQVFIMTRGGPAQATDLFSLFVYRTGFKHSHLGYAAALSWVMLLASSLLLLLFVRSSGIFRSEPRPGAEPTAP